MHEIPLADALVAAAVLFAVGLAGALVRRNIILALLSIEIMLNAAGLAFIAAGAHWRSPDGQVMFMFILTAAAVEVSVGLALTLRQSHCAKTLDSNAASTLKG